MAELSFHAARSRVANLCKTRTPNDPEVVQMRRVMHEQFVVHKVEKALDMGPALTPHMRDQIIELLESHMATTEAVFA